MEQLKKLLVVGMFFSILSLPIFVYGTYEAIRALMISGFEINVVWWFCLFALLLLRLIMTFLLWRSNRVNFFYREETVIIVSILYLIVTFLLFKVKFWFIIVPICVNSLFYILGAIGHRLVRGRSYHF